MMVCYFKEDNTAPVKKCMCVCIYVSLFSCSFFLTRLRFYHKLLSKRDMVSLPKVYFAKY